MRTLSIQKAGLWAVLAALIALVPGSAIAQPGMGAGDYSPPDPQMPLPLYSNRPDVGGLFVSGGYVMYQQNNPLQSQPVAYRGFIASQPFVQDPTGVLPGSVVPIIDPLSGNPAFQGQFIGSRALALDVKQLRAGPAPFQPGFSVEAGWKFGDGSALTVSYMWMSEVSQRADATLVNTANQSFGNLQQDTFLTSFVSNFPSEFAGAPAKILIPDPLLGGIQVPATGAVYGIWNGASVQTLSFLQRAQQLQATYRKPFYETENYRVSALVGPRYFWIAEKFRWVTTDLDFTGASSPIFQATYNNQVDNHMYGVHVGMQQEWYVGHGFALMLSTEVAGFMNIVKEQIDYERGDRGGPENKRNRTQYTAVPEVQVTPNIMWYPIEGVQLQAGWDYFAFFNTISSPHPIDFNYSSLNPDFRSTFRYFQGFTASIAFVF